MRLTDVLSLGAAPPTVDGVSARRRRRTAVALTLIVGTALLAATLHSERGSGWFALLGLMLAATWILGAAVSGPIAIQPFRPGGWRTVVVPAVVLGLAAFAGFFALYLAARHLPIVSDALDNVLRKADAGPLAVVLAVAMVNGVAEELFFRGALCAALEPRHPAVTSTLVYVAVTAATGNGALVAAAAVMGALFSRERLSTRSVLAPMVTHVAWSTLMLLALPR